MKFSKDSEFFLKFLIDKFNIFIKKRSSLQQKDLDKFYQKIFDDINAADSHIKKRNITRLTQTHDFNEGLNKAEQGFQLLNKELVEGMLPLQDKAYYGLTDDDVADVEDEAENLRQKRSGEEQDEEQGGQEEEQKQKKAQSKYG